MRGTLSSTSSGALYIQRKQNGAQQANKNFWFLEKWLAAGEENCFRFCSSWCHHAMWRLRHTFRGKAISPLRHDLWALSAAGSTAPAAPDTHFGRLRKAGQRPLRNLSCPIHLAPALRMLRTGLALLWHWPQEGQADDRTDTRTDGQTDTQTPGVADAGWRTRGGGRGVADAG